MTVAKFSVAMLQSPFFVNFAIILSEGSTRKVVPHFLALLSSVKLLSAMSSLLFKVALLESFTQLQILRLHKNQADAVNRIR